VDLPTKLDRVERRSQQDRNAVFNNLGHIIDIDLLRDCYHGLDGTKAVGIDGITKEDYGKNLEENLKHLLTQIRKGSYHPKPSRIREIPKADGSMRPLAIACFEDKIVQEAVRQIIERIYEPLFLDCSHGFRPNRGCHSALSALGKHLMSWECGAVLEIDLRKYFNTIPHEHLVRLVKLKISDERFLHLIIKLLKAPFLNAEGRAERNELGSPQGSILSPVISNLYLHYVLDIWFSWLNQKRFGGSARMIRYADDAVFTFRNLAEAEQFRTELVQRLESFGIAIHEAKTKVIVYGPNAARRYEQQGGHMPTFSFLGFVHVWGASISRRTGKRFWRVKRRTDPRRFRKKLAEIKVFISKHRHEKDLVIRVKRITQGYLNYFAVNDNGKRVSQFVHEVKRTLFKYLNRRSQKRSLDWPRFNRILIRVRFPKPVLKNLFFDLRTPGPQPGACR
jgi:group II intron reverse transcriptase/maturase